MIKPQLRTSGAKKPWGWFWWMTRKSVKFENFWFKTRTFLRGRVQVCYLWCRRELMDWIFCTGTSISNIVLIGANPLVHQDMDMSHVRLSHIKSQRRRRELLLSINCSAERMEQTILFSSWNATPQTLTDNQIIIIIINAAVQELWKHYRHFWTVLKMAPNTYVTRKITLA